MEKQCTHMNPGKAAAASRHPGKKRTFMGKAPTQKNVACMNLKRLLVNTVPSRRTSRN
jgi:hypothetical protein